MDKILILDNGGQTTALIGRRIREAGVYTEILPGDAPLTDTVLEGVKGIVLSGGPESVYTGAGPVPDRRVYECGLPLLGICYGLQRMNYDNGGEVAPLPKREFGGVRVFVAPHPSPLTPHPFPPSFSAWMSHGDTLTKLGPGFVEAGRSETGFPAIVCHSEKPWFGVQFHPEVSHCEHGEDILRAFVFNICKCKAEWSMEAYIEQAKAEIRAKAGSAPVLLLISGGVDSTVAAALLLSALPRENVHLMYMDTGLMRKNETQTVREALSKLGAKNLHIVHCEDEFFASLAGCEAPEAKRKVIGDLFITIQERETAKLGLPRDYFLAQGTLYTDLIESGRGVGKKAHVIKSHHNVASPLVAAKRAAGLIIEPLDRLYKDEVRRLGRILGLDAAVVGRHPFPGPGLGVRILGEVTREKADILREADAVFIDELRKRQAPEGGSLYDAIWQAFAVLLPVRSVGVAGDSRAYGYVLALRAVTSADGMTSDVYGFDAKTLLEISTLITNTVPQVGRVVYDISSKPPATIEWE